MRARKRDNRYVLHTPAVVSLKLTLRSDTLTAEPSRVDLGSESHSPTRGAVGIPQVGNGYRTGYHKKQIEPHKPCNEFQKALQTEYNAYAFSPWA
jgi:hypothetical protein